MPLSAEALTTVANARLWCLRDAADASKDDLFTLLINSVSKQVKRFCARQFFPDENQTYLFAYDGGGTLNLAPYEINAEGTTPIVITVTPATGTAVTLSNTAPDNGVNFRFEPRNKTEEGTYLWLRLPQFNNPGAFPASAHTGLGSEVAITADWGMPSLPDDLEEAVLTIIEDRYLNPAAAKRIQVGPNTIDPDEGQRDSESPFPPRAMEILEGIARSQFAR